MKRFFALAALVLGMVSCQTEPEGLDVIVGGEVESFVTVSITETTRATSADSGLTNVNPDAYDLRYILEVYDKENDVFVYRDVQTVETDVKSVSFPVRLIPERSYNFVVWADFVTNGSEDDLYYNTLYYGTNGLNAVTIADGKWVAMDEARDAYTAVALVEKYNSGKSINLDLIRPFGKLRVVTTDIKALEALAYDALPEAVRVEYNTEVYSRFNALTETATNPADATFAYDLAAVYDYDDYVDANTTSLTLFTDYIFGTETGTIQFDMTVTYKNGNEATNSFNTEIPVKRNYLTTITGDILTDGNNINVEVEDGFENGQNPNNPPYYQETISSAADFLAAVNEGGEYIIISDINISSNPTTLAVTRTDAAPKTTTIDLNGYTITVENKNTTGAALITLTDGQTIVFEGEGEITLTNDSTAAFIDATNGCVVVEGGDVEEDVVDGNFFEVESNEDSLALLQYICNNGGTFTFTRDIVGDVTVNQKGHNIVIDGNGFNFDGTIVVDGKNEYPSNYTLVIKNVNFETNRANVDFIRGLSGHNEYPHNITIENCSFNDTAASQTVVGMRFSQFYNLRVINCTGTNLHSLLQAQSCDHNVLIDGVRITDSKGGISFGNTANATIKNSTIDVEGYGVRSDGDRTVVSLTVENCDIDAYIPVCVRRLTSSACHYNLTFVGDNALTAGGLYQATLCSNEYEDGVSPILPVSTYTLTGADEYSIFPMYADVYTEEDLANAFANGANFITLCDDITLNDAWTPVGNSENPWCGVFDGKGYTIDGLTVVGVDYAAFISHSAANSCVKNVSFTNVNLQSTKHAATVVCVAEEGLTLENITVTGEITAASYAGGIMHNGANATITNCVNNANITANRAGGIASWVTTGANIENVTNNGKITGLVGAAGIAHGFAGSIKNATNNGEISSANLEAAGGIVGVQKAASTYEYCYNYGNVTSTYDDPNASAAGILGQSCTASTLKYCANYGTITAEQSAAAGIAYSLYGSINASYCYNEGAVEGADSAGGIAPKAAFGTGDKANYCLNAGAITSANGIVYQGSNNNTSSFYYNDGVLYNVTGNTKADANTALQILNGGADTDFFSMENSMITVIK